MLRSSCCLLFLCLASSLAQRGREGERQIRLEDIEQDNLANQKAQASPQQQATPQSQTPQHAQQTPSQQQLAAYQQQLLLQQLQQQYFAPVQLPYNHFGGVPLMILHGNQLGLGGPGGVPIQAYFVPEPHYVPQYYHHPLQQRYQPTQTTRLPVQSVQRLPVQDLTYNSLQVSNIPQTVPQASLYRQPHNYPSASIVYPGTPTASSYPQAQAYQSPAQLYNAYNALYQQRQEKNSFGAGVKSTPAPSVKPQSQVYTSQQAGGQTYSNYKALNYNQ